jgi:integrase
LKYLREYAGNISISEISEKWVGGYRDFLLQQSSLGPNTQSRYLASLRRVLNQALRENLLPRSLTRNLKPIKEQEPDTEFLNTDEVAILGATPLPPGIPEDIRRAFLFSCFVGLRVSDLQSLTWAMIDRSAHEIKKRQKKTRRFIVVPIKDSAWALIDDGIFHQQDEKVFPCLHDKKGSTNRLLQRWAKKANISKRLTWHVARRTFGTLALRSGADLATVSKLLGHTSIAYTQRYLKVDSASVQAAINAMPEIDLIAKAGKVIPMKRAEGYE